MNGSNDKTDKRALRKKAIREAFDELMAMDDRAFRQFLDVHRDGDIAQALLYANAFEGERENAPAMAFSSSPQYFLSGANIGDWSYLPTTFVNASLDWVMLPELKISGYLVGSTSIETLPPDQSVYDVCVDEDLRLTA